MSSRAGGNGNVPLRVAMVGIRGIPANFGGSETAVQEIGRRLVVDHGADVVVYCRRHSSPNDDPSYLGMRRIVLPSINSFNFDTISHSLLSSLHILARNTADVVHFSGVGNGLCLVLFALSRKQTVVTVDGPDWERPKWGRVARLALKLGARFSVRWADGLIIDNHPSIAYFREAFGVDGTYIPYGADFDRVGSTSYLESLGVEPRRYVLFVGALVPDKGPDVLVDAYRSVDTDMPLLVVGDSPFHPDYGAALRTAAAKDDRVRMLGYVYGDRYRELVSHAYVYAHPLRSDGTSPALLQALAYGNAILINSLPEALSAVGDAALPYARNDSADLARQLQRLLEDPPLVEDLRQRAYARARAEYDWDKVTAQHRDLYREVLAD